MMAAGSAVDDDASRGQFLLNGSADFLTVPTISESLAGRAAFLELWPLTQGEMHHEPDGFIEALSQTLTGSSKAEPRL